MTHFITCEKCGKKLIERKSNGIWVFKFGRNGKNGSEPLVNMEICGSIKMTCLRRSCRYVNTLHFFPGGATIENETNKDNKDNK